jgi:hypothetical protein
MTDVPPENIISDMQQSFAAVFWQLRAQYKFGLGEYGWNIHHDTEDGRKLTFKLRVNIKDRSAVPTDEPAVLP